MAPLAIKPYLTFSGGTLEKVEINLTQNELPQLQDLYHFPHFYHSIGLIRAFVYSKFQ